MSGLKALFGDTVYGADMKEVSVDSLAENDVIGIYFSAHWCPPCRGFTPMLAETYKKIKAAGKKFEVVFVSSDRDEASFKEYFGEMPWLTLGFPGEKKDELAAKYSVRGIPTLILVDKDGNTKHANGREIIVNDQTGASFPWSK